MSLRFSIGEKKGCSLPNFDTILIGCYLLSFQAGTELDRDVREIWGKRSIFIFGIHTTLVLITYNKTSQALL
jgi:hypothetical protein